MKHIYTVILENYDILENAELRRQGRDEWLGVWGSEGANRAQGFFRAVGCSL